MSSSTSSNLVQVNDEKGKLLLKVQVGDTKLQALERLSQVDGILENSDGLALLGTQCITAEEAPYVFKPQPQKRQKVEGEFKDTGGPTGTFTDLIGRKDFHEAYAKLEEVSRHFESEGEHVERNKLCIPFKMYFTCGEEQLGSDLRHHRNILLKKISNPRDNRDSRVIAIRLGTGCGKTHLLLEAPKLLNAFGIYITFNLDQNLSQDVQSPQQTILLRILLRLQHFPNKNCHGFFKSKEGQELLSIGEKNVTELRSFVVDRLTKLGKDIFIGVDEVMDLAYAGKFQNDNVVQLVLSELGEVADSFYQRTKRMCTVLVTSLNEEPFVKSKSGRDLLRWSPPPPDRCAIEMIMNHFRGNLDLDQCVATVAATGGHHFRSIVLAADDIGKHRNPTVQSVLLDIYDRVKAKAESEFGDTKAYVIGACMGSEHARDFWASKEKIEGYLDASGALPPALICGAFGVVDLEGNLQEDDPLYGVFNVDTVYMDPAKHLEHFCLHFDLFRHKNNIPVVSAGVVVHIPSSGNGFKPRAWYKALQFPDNMETSKDSLFARTPNGVIPTETAKAPSITKYYHPEVENHPWIDRAFIALNVTSNVHEECFVLYQDKVNDDLPKAIIGLNAAADLLKEHHPLRQVLCIANVIGASEQTRSQKDFKYPYILIRTKKESTAFYSANFASIVEFVGGHNLRCK